jgi:hypothetical protein
MQKATPKQYHSTTGEAHKKGEKKTVQKRREDFERNHKICISHPPTLNFQVAMKLSGTRNCQMQNAQTKPHMIIITTASFSQMDRA